MVTEQQVWQALQEVTDPEFPLNIVDLGMVYDVSVDKSHVTIEITFTSIGCPAIDMIISDIKDSVHKVPGISSLDVDIVWSPPWTKNKISSEGREILQYYGVVN